MTTWFTSDLHFNHVNIMKYGRNEHFDSLEEMNEMIVENHNSVVAPLDHVIVFGDVVMGKRAEGLPFIERMNGRKTLILGNHDYPHPCNPEKIVNKWTDIYQDFFISMHTGIQIDLGFMPAWGSHFPAVMQDHTDEVRYAEFRPVTEYESGMPIIHGHLHCEKIHVAPRHVHVGIDADYTSYGVKRYHPIPYEVVQHAVIASNIR
jgi:calcineurin-like phosphoesterase family protein